MVVRVETQGLYQLPRNAEIGMGKPDECWISIEMIQCLSYAVSNRRVSFNLQLIKDNDTDHRPEEPRDTKVLNCSEEFRCCLCTLSRLVSPFGG